MYQENPDIRISKIERQKNTVHFTINGVPVTAVCSSQDDSGIFENVKRVLIGKVLSSGKKGLTKLDRFPQR